MIVDGLDSCEQDKVLLVLDAIQALFSDSRCPFVVILAIDPHIIAKVCSYTLNTLTSYQIKSGVYIVKKVKVEVNSSLKSFAFKIYLQLHIVDGLNNGF